MRQDNIYISSVAFAGYSVEEMIEVAVSNALPIEFSSGMPFKEDMEKIYLTAPVKRLAHNYFPAPLKSFVLNLASSNEEIRRKSIDHCINGLKLSKLSGATFFAAHAGFCIDPSADDLGKPLNYNNDFDKGNNWSFFIRSIKEVLNVADDLQTDFLIENNVIASFNLQNNINPLFCCDSKDISALFSEVLHPRLGLLLDTAHLKVSCVTLDLNIEEELGKLRPYISALHHSDNDGDSDTNEQLDNDYWFLPFIKEYQNKIHVIEVKNITVQEMHNHIKLLQQYAVN